MTMQSPEILFFEEQEMRMQTTPLDSYLLMTKQEPPSGSIRSSACWRGYIGTWKVESNRLYLIDLTDPGERAEREITLGTVFPNFPAGAFAHWFSGRVRCRKPDAPRSPTDSGWGQGPQEVHLQFRQGVLTRANADDVEPSEAGRHDPGEAGAVAPTQASGGS